MANSPPDTPRCSLPYIVHFVTRYPFSKDYVALASLATTTSVICVVEVDGIQYVAQTLFFTGDMWRVVWPGKCLISAQTPEEFVKQCERYDVKFIPPSP